MTTRKQTAYALTVLFAINTMNFFDRQILGAVGELIKGEWKLSDTALGTLGTAFIILYALVGLPLGRLADRSRRTQILSAGVFVWSVFTVASGLATRYWQLFLVRLGVGVGEASCAPASNSLIGDLFPASRRARAMSVFMLGLPIGIALSYLVSSQVAFHYGWRSAFYIAGIPGILCAVAALMMKEPKRGASEVHDIGGQKREGSPYWLVLSIPTMWWIIASGALHNFNMYAIGSFLSPFLRRIHYGDLPPAEAIKQAGIVAMFINGLVGVPGLVLGGFFGDWVMQRRKNGRLLVAALALLISSPLIYFSLGSAPGQVAAFAVLMGMGVMMMYVYYSTVYTTIQDVIEPSLRGTAMALYFCAMYVLGAALGPLGTGFLSDHFTLKAALAAGATDLTEEGLKPYAPQGLRSALYILPLLNLLLALVLFAASRTVTKDMEKLQRWMRESAGKAAKSEQVKAATGD